MVRAVMSGEIQLLIHNKPTILLLWSTDPIGCTMDDRGRLHLELLRDTIPDPRSTISCP
jgi:hypothetical protein